MCGHEFCIHFFRFFLKSPQYSVNKTNKVKEICLRSHLDRARTRIQINDV